MAHHLIRWVTNEPMRQQTIDYLRPLRDGFVKPGASKLAASYILDKLVRSGSRLPHLPSDVKVA